MNQTAPIVLFVYNRLDHTRKTLQALQENNLAEESELYIFSDGPKDIAAATSVSTLRSYLTSVTGFKKIHIRLRETNFGVDDNIIQGVTEVVNRHGRVIVLEDDLVTSPWFLQYMNEGLNYYETNEDVISIHGYIYPVTVSLKQSFFLKGADCWGWATWKKEWKLFEADGSILLRQIEARGLQEEFDFNNTYPYTKALEQQAIGNTKEWDIRWYASAFLLNKLTLYPGKSLVHNIGNDGSGTHCGDSEEYDVELAQSPISVVADVKPDLEAYQAFAEFLRRRLPIVVKKGVLSRSFKKIKSLFRPKV
ncbi:glycosyltransferase family protein [Pedobacter psychroterrae]|uniref:Glycosyltransferase n=1 Tax=Pedobacter psychroterrae TaxID=2530453 RepID=A0A4V2MLV0_9SPHI|nr:glycosyltransferase [Pedobacter psychroterrae]TCD03307.1 glycosyltransferase [Pedobacter psychroterrae]